MTLQANPRELGDGKLFEEPSSFSDIVSCSIHPTRSREIMASVGFSTAEIEYKLDNPMLVNLVCMAILEPSCAEFQDSLAVLVFFKSARKGQIMMADSTELPDCYGSGDLTVVRVLRKAIPGLGREPIKLRDKIFDDVQKASGKSPPQISNPSVKEISGGKEEYFQSRFQSPSLSQPRRYNQAQEGHQLQLGLRANAQSFVPRKDPRKPGTGARSDQQTSTKSGSSSRRPPPPNQFKCSVFVSHIVAGATWHDLQSAFSTQVAPTLRVYMKPGCSWAHVYFYDLKGVEMAIEAAAAGLIKICGRPARVRRRTRKKKVKRNQQPIGNVLSGSGMTNANRSVFTPHQGKPRSFEREKNLGPKWDPRSDFNDVIDMRDMRDMRGASSQNAQSSSIPHWDSKKQKYSSQFLPRKEHIDFAPGDYSSSNSHNADRAAALGQDVSRLTSRLNFMNLGWPSNSAAGEQGFTRNGFFARSQNTLSSPPRGGGRYN